MACLLVLAALLNLYSTYKEKQAKQEAAQQLNETINNLKGQVEAGNITQASNTDRFLRSLSAVSREVGDLRMQVRTEELQKRLASVDAELQRTRSALTAPTPKAALQFSFEPYDNPPATSAHDGAPTLETSLPIDGKGVVRVPWTVVNTTSVAAVDIELTLVICDSCRFAKEPAGSTHQPEQSGVERNHRFGRILASQKLFTQTVDVIVPPGANAFELALTYRCSTCVVNHRGFRGTVHVLRASK